MESLHWRHLNFPSRNMAIPFGKNQIGQLKFQSRWTANAFFITETTKISFIETGLLTNSIKISYNGELAGEMKSTFFSAPSLRLKNQKTFFLKSNLFGRNLKWVGINEKEIINFKQSKIGSFRKGKIEIAEEVTLNERELLISAGLFAHQLIVKKVSQLVLILIPIFILSKV